MAESPRWPDPFDFSLLDGLASFRVRVLMLDYDGTLAPFRSERMEAVPYPGVRPALEKLCASGGTVVAIVSGRPVDEVLTLLGDDLPVDVWGAHGWERRTAEGRFETWKPSEEVQGVLEEAARRGASRLPKGVLEVKSGSVAAHTRALTPAERAAVQRVVQTAWKPLAAAAGLHFRTFDGGYELRLSGRTKATAVRVLRAELVHDDAERALFAYLGDDETDEDAFSELREGDWPILVRAKARPSAARYQLVPPVDLLHFFDLWTIHSR